MNLLSKMYYNVSNLFRRTNNFSLQLDDIQALQFLTSLYKIDIKVPYTRWSMSPSLILHIVNDILINKRRKIIEFGSGVSTIIIEDVIQKMELSCEFYSIESDIEWYTYIQSFSNTKSELILAPIVASPFVFKNHKNWHSIKVLDGHLKNEIDFDCVIIDGPPAYVSPYSRYPALPYLKDKISSSFSIFLDDTFRKEENEILTEWEKIVDNKFSSRKRYSYLSTGSFDSQPLLEQYADIASKVFYRGLEK